MLVGTYKPRPEVRATNSSAWGDWSTRPAFRRGLYLHHQLVLLSGPDEPAKVREYPITLTGESTGTARIAGKVRRVVRMRRVGRDSFAPNCWKLAD